MKSNGKKAGSTYSDDEDHVGDVDDDDPKTTTMIMIVMITLH